MRVLVILLLLAGCTSTPEGRMYNHNREQDPSCYARFGGQLGYCDKKESR